MAVMPAIAGSNYSQCVEASNPAQCLARRAVNSSRLDPEDTLEMVLRHGLVDMVPAKSDKLMRGLYDSIGEPDAKMDTPEEQELDSLTDAVLRKTPRKSLLAAMALVSAARYNTNPFANPVYLRLARQAKDDPLIPALALVLWFDVVGYGSSPPRFMLTHAGLPVIWDRAVARKEQDAILLEDIAHTLAYLGVLKSQSQEFYAWYLQRPGLTAEQRVGPASALARFFEMPEQAASMLEGVGDDVKSDYDIGGVRTSVAAARLAKGYDAGAAQLVMRTIFDEINSRDIYSISFDRFFDTEYRDALERGNARDELRELGDECLRRAKAAGGKPEAADWYAGASDFYLRAGDRERAREMARLGLPFVPVFLRRYLESNWDGDRNDPKAMAIAARGAGTKPVIALYRTGAIDETLETGYLIGMYRYLNAERAGEKKNPQWAIDDTSVVDTAVMAREAESSTDRQFQQRAYDGLVRSCRTSLVDCYGDTLLHIAQVAAGMGDEPRMKEALAAATRQLDKSKLLDYWAQGIAGTWAHCEEILPTARQAAAR
jgi:hypothetical protein